jgi:hypothetical protein
MPDFKYDKIIHKGADHETVAEMVCQWANGTLAEEKIEINIVATDIVTAPDPENPGNTIYVAITIFQFRDFY